MSSPLPSISATSILAMMLFSSIFMIGSNDGSDESTWNVSIPIELSFDRSSLRAEVSNGLIHLTAEGYGIPSEEGSPFVPITYVRVLVPASTTSYELAVSSLDLVHFDTGPIASVPVQRPIGSDPVSTIPEAFTTGIVSHLEIASEGMIRGYRVLEIRFNPVIPDDRGVEISTSARASILVRTDPDQKVADVSAPEKISGSVINPLNIRSFGSLAYTPSGKLPNGSFEYVVITDPSKVQNAFDDLVEWKTQKGVPAAIYTTTQIYANYTGKDNQEKVRNFIRDAVTTWGSEYVLLGGDTAVIPYRGLYCSAGGYTEYDIASDLYYSALDGNFNADNDTVWGETNDQVDLYYDVIVGRAPVQTFAEAANFVERTLKYEKDPPTGYLDRVLLAGEYLDGSTNSSLGLDLIKGILPTNSIPTSLYDKASGVPGTLSKNSFIYNVNAGVNYAYHSGHSNENTMSMGSPGGGAYDLYNSDMGKYNGSYKLGIINSLGCITTRFNVDDCIAEEHVKRTIGGSVAFIGNSRYGWYAGGAPGWGTSEVFQASMADELYNYGTSGLGEHYTKGKDAYAAYATSGTARWVMFALNLIGDPEPDVWTAEPTPLNVSYPVRIGLNCSTYEVSALNVTGAAVEGALICLVHNGYYETNLTNSSGRAVFRPYINDSSDLRVTATAWNHRPFTANVSVDLELPSVMVNVTGQPTTGDPYVLRCRATDNFGIGSVLLSYRQGDDPNGTTVAELEGNGTYYNKTIGIHENDLENITFSFMVRDISGNVKSTDWMTLSVFDNDAPELEMVPPRFDPTTGDPFSVAAAVSDNIAVDSVSCDVLLDGAPYRSLTMERGEGTLWSGGFPVDEGSSGLLSFLIGAIDTSGNGRSIDGAPMRIRDNDPISFISDLSDAEGTTGDPLHLKVRVADNWGFGQIYARWRPSGTTLVTNMPLSGEGGIFQGIVNVPSSFTDVIRYSFGGDDPTGNWNETEEREVQVRDNDPPNITSVNAPERISTGDIFAISISAKDNCQLANASITVMQGDRRISNGTMVPASEGMYSYDVTAPENSTLPLIFGIVVTDEASNLYTSGPWSIVVLDDDPPRILMDSSDRYVMVGHIINFTISAGDNIGIGSVAIEWWLAGSSEKTKLALCLDRDRWTGTDLVPEDATGMLYYKAYVRDLTGNMIDGGRRSVTLIIPPPPEEPKVILPLPGEDRDHDGMEDLWELMHNLSIERDDSAEDLDNDTWSNLAEYLAGTDPEDPEDHPMDQVPDDPSDVNYLLPILILLVLGAVIFILLVFLLVRRRSSDDFSIEME